VSCNQKRRDGKGKGKGKRIISTVLLKNLKVKVNRLILILMTFVSNITEMQVLLKIMCVLFNSIISSSSSCLVLHLIFYSFPSSLTFILSHDRVQCQTGYKFLSASLL